MLFAVRQAFRHRSSTPWAELGRLNMTAFARQGLSANHPITAVQVGFTISVPSSQPAMRRRLAKPTSAEQGVKNTYYRSRSRYADGRVRCVRLELLR
jgi:hypothetical protein